MVEIAEESAGQRKERLSTFASLQNRNYFVFWCGGLASFIGMQMQMVAQGWLVLLLTDSPFYLGLVGAVSSIPILALSLFGGVTADRIDRRNLLITTQSLMFLPVLAIALLVTAGAISIWHLLVLSFIGGAVASFNMPARQALVADLVKRDELMNAIALNSAGMNVTRIIGPSIGGIMVGAIGVAGAYYINSAAYVIVVATLLMIPAMGAATKHGGQNVWKNMGDGLRYIRNNEVIRTLLIIGTFAGIFGMSYQMLMPVFARDILQVGASGLGFLMAAAGIGALAGSLIIASLGNAKRKGWIMIGSGLGFGLALMLFAFSANFVLSLCLQVLIGAMSTAAMATNNTILQTIVPNELRGRVVSIMMLTFGLMPLGSLLSGAIASWVGTPLAVAASGGVVVLAIMVIAILSPAVRELD